MKRLVIGLISALWCATVPIGAQSLSAGEFGSAVGFSPVDSELADGYTSAGYWGAPAWIDPFADWEGVEAYPIVIASFAYIRDRQALAQGSREDIERANEKR
jgi:hypothetical protein